MLKLGRGRAYRVGRIIGLLQSNYQDTDWVNIIEPLTRSSVDEDEYHLLGFSVRDILARHLTPLAIPSLINLYQHGPCANCRETFLDYLAQMDAIPNWLREEARYDAFDYIRELITKTDPL